MLPPSAKIKFSSCFSPDRNNVNLPATPGLLCRKREQLNVFMAGKVIRGATEGEGEGEGLGVALHPP